MIAFESTCNAFTNVYCLTCETAVLSNDIFHGIVTASSAPKPLPRDAQTHTLAHTHTPRFYRRVKVTFNALRPRRASLAHQFSAAAPKQIYLKSVSVAAPLRCAMLHTSMQRLRVRVCGVLHLERNNMRRLDKICNILLHPDSERLYLRECLCTTNYTYLYILYMYKCQRPNMLCMCALCGSGSRWFHRERADGNYSVSKSPFIRLSGCC